MRARMLALLIGLIGMIWPATQGGTQTGFCGQFNTPCWTTDTRPSPAFEGDWGYNRTLGVFEGFDGSTWTGFGNGSVSITDLGAKCDGGTDDAVAINAAVAIIRSLGFGKLSSSKIGSCIFRSTLNFTNIDASGYTNPPIGTAPPIGLPWGTIIDLGNVVLGCHVTGGVCIDATNTKHLFWQSLNVYGDQTDMPTIGFQFGSPCWVSPNCATLATPAGQPSITASQNMFTQNWINGYFSQHTKINFNSEGSKEFGGVYRNFQAGANVYTVDCINHYNLVSAFTTVTRNVDASTICQGPAFYDTIIQAGVPGVGTGGPALWVAGAYGIYMDAASYTSTTGPNAVVVYNLNDTSAARNLHFEQHIEAYPTLQTALLFTGPQPTWTLNGLYMEDTAQQSAFAIFAPDFATGVSSAIVTNLIARYPNAPQAAGITMFGNYQGVTAATISSGGNCPNNTTYQFTVSGGTGVAATITGTITAGALAGALTVSSAGKYQVTPGATGSLSGGGCTLAPVVNLTYATVVPPLSVTGSVYADSATTLTPMPLNFGGMFCAGGACNFAPSARFDGGPGPTPNTSSWYGPSTGAIGVATGGGGTQVAASGRGAFTLGGSWVVGSGGTVQTDNAVANPASQVQAIVNQALPYRAGQNVVAYAGTEAGLASNFVGGKSRGTGIGTNTAVVYQDLLRTDSAQGTDSLQFLAATSTRSEVGHTVNAGSRQFTTGSATVSTPGTAYTVGDVLTLASGGICGGADPQYTVASITGSAATGPIASVTAVNGRGPCSASFGATAAAGGTGAGAVLTPAFTTASTPGIVPGKYIISTASQVYSALLPGTAVAPGWSGDTGSCAASASFTATVNGGTCPVPPVFNVTSNSSGQISGVSSLATAGQCTTAPTNPAQVTASTCTNARLNVQYSSLVPAISIGMSQVSSFLGFAQVMTSLTANIIGKCNANHAGSLVMVTDATAPAYNANLVGGGAVAALAMCNGTVWVTP